MQHTERTQYAHTQKQKQKKQNNMQYIEDNTEQHTEQNTDTETNNHAQPQRTENSTYDLHTYSLDLYHEYAYIKNSNTIELYTILK